MDGGKKTCLGEKERKFSFTKCFLMYKIHIFLFHLYYGTVM